MTSASAPAAAWPDRTAPEDESLPALLLRQVPDRPRQVALRVKQLGYWCELTWAEYARRAARIGLGLRAMGLARADRVVIIAANRPEWLMVDVGAQGVGLVTVPLDPELAPSELAALLRRVAPAVVVVDDALRYEVVSALPELVAVPHVVVIDPRGMRSFPGPSVTSLEEVESSAEAPDDDVVTCWHEAAVALESDAPATVMATAGVTGTPKLAVLSHAALVAAARAVVDGLPVTAGGDVLSCMPLALAGERVISELGALLAGAVVNFGEGPETFAEDMRQVQPTLFFAVPRVWDRMLATVSRRLAAVGWPRRRLFEALLGDRRGARPHGMLARLLVLRPLHRQLGLSRVQVALTGGASISAATIAGLAAIALTVRDCYGLAEMGGLATCVPADDPRPATVGRALPGVEVRVDGGEILLRSEAALRGYLDGEAPNVDADGWLRTGDLGTLDNDGLRVVGRLADVIDMPEGARVSPQPIEQLLRESPYVSDAVITRGSPGLRALVGLEPDTVGGWANRRHLPFTTYRDLVERPEVRGLVGSEVDRVNGNLHGTPQIDDLVLLPSSLADEEGALATNGYARRAVVVARFAPATDDGEPR